MKFKEVAHLYIGCKVQWAFQNPFSDDEDDVSITDFTISDAKWLLNHTPKPFLYPLSAMTDEQYIEVNRAYGTFANEIWFTPSEFNYLLSHHFDLFNLIESGEAIDVTTLETNPYKEEVTPKKEIKP